MHEAKFRIWKLNFHVVSVCCDFTQLIKDRQRSAGSDKFWFNLIKSNKFGNLAYEFMCIYLLI